MQTLRNFFTLAAPFWGRKKHWPDWLLLITVVGFALAIIRVSVRITEWNKAFYDALADFNGVVIPKLIINYLGYMILIVAFIACGNLLRKLLVFRWRESLTAQFQAKWLTQHKHYRLQLFGEPDNPDQRIAEDIYLLADKTIDLFKYFVMNVAKLGAFITILWQLSGVQNIEIFDRTFRIHGYLVWLALAYSVLCTWLMHLIGYKLQTLNVERQHKEADYRAALLRIRDNAEQIALYHGERREQKRLNERFSLIKQNWLALINREFRIELFSAGYLRISMFIPVFATLPLYLAKTMTFGDMMQARSAFSNVQDGFGWFMDYYKRLMEWAAVIERLAEFQTALARLDNIEPKKIRPENPPHLQTFQLGLQTPQGRILAQNISFSATAGDWILIDGKSGIGKTTLLRTLAGLMSPADGRYEVRSNSFLFLPQTPYLPDDSLRAVLSYPAAPIESDEKLRHALNQVGLNNLESELDTVKEWHKTLSGGEQQRISLARALLYRPSLLFLDESTNQLDDEAALTLIRKLKTALPQCLCLAISHQTEVKKQFNRRLQLSW